MAKKKITKKKVTGKKTATAPGSARGASGASARGGKKSTRKKTTPAKTTKKKTSSGSGTTAKKRSGKKVARKSTKKKTPAKKTTKKAVKKTARKSPTAKATTRKKVVKKKAAKKTSKKKTSPAKGSKVAPKGGDAGKPAPAKPDAVKPAPGAKSDEKAPGGAKPGAQDQGDNRRRRAPKSKKPVLVMPERPLLLGPNGPALKPLIPSGARVQEQQSVLDNVTSRRKKTPLTKAQLEHYRHILLNKRAELLGDMRHLEDEALRNDSGRSNATSQHLAEQGSDSYEQTLNLNLAASDRDRINEIDAALTRIADRTYGLCELTFEPIRRARLDEIPWARYTIEAARELDRRNGVKR